MGEETVDKCFAEYIQTVACISSSGALLRSGNLSDISQEPLVVAASGNKSVTLTVNDLIAQLEQVEDKSVGVVSRRNCHITDVIDIFTCEADGTVYICIDCEDK